MLEETCGETLGNMLVFLCLAIYCDIDREIYDVGLAESMICLLVGSTLPVVMMVCQIEASRWLASVLSDWALPAAGRKDAVEFRLSKAWRNHALSERLPTGPRSAVPGQAPAICR